MRALQIIACLLVFGISACHQNKQIGEVAKSIANTHDSTGINLDSVPCADLAKKSVVLAFANDILRILPEDSGGYIWNLSSVDTANYFTTEDYFINPAYKHRVVLMHGMAGMSAGNTDNLLLVFDCSPLAKLIWAGQVAPFTAKDIVDVDDDGVKDILIQTSAMWMDNYTAAYSIFNFKGGKQNFLFKRESNSLISPTDFTIDERYEPSKGDTIKEWYDCKLIKLNSTDYAIRQVKTIQVFDGKSPLPPSVDTTMIPLNK